MESDPPQQQHKRPASAIDEHQDSAAAAERAVRAKAAAADGAAGGDDSDLDALYGGDSVSAPEPVAVAAEAVAAAPEAAAPPPPAATEAAATEAAAPAAAATAAAEEAAAAGPSTGGGTSGGGGGGGNNSSSSRAPPLPIVKPALPADLVAAFSNAVMLVDKPKGWTSFDACNALKGALKRMGIPKIGHAGTLDPDATGLLIICSGAGTKSIERFMGMPKEYTGTLKLGEGTPSLDAATPVDEVKPWEHITDDMLRGAAAKLTGDIMQVPPMFSALHHGGKRLHELARAGETVERAARPVTVARFDVERDASDPQLVHFRVECSKGTYVRSLAADLGAALGSAAHLTALRREAIGDFRVSDAWGVEELRDAIFAGARAAGVDMNANSGGGGGRGGGNRRGGGRRGGGRGGGGGGRKGGGGGGGGE